MAEKLTKITETTLIPISLMGVLIGGVFWLTTIYNNTQANAIGLTELKISQDSLVEKLSEKQTLMLDRLSRIEGRLESIQHRRDK